MDCGRAFPRRAPHNCGLLPHRPCFPIGGLAPHLPVLQFHTGRLRMHTLGCFPAPSKMGCLGRRGRECLALELMLLSSSLAIWNGDPQVVQLAVPLLGTASQVAPRLEAAVSWRSSSGSPCSQPQPIIYTLLFARLGRQPTPGLVGGLLVLSFALSLFGFSSLIQLLYPFFGYLRCCCWLQMIIYRWRRRFLMRRK